MLPKVEAISVDRYRLVKKMVPIFQTMNTRKVGEQSDNQLQPPTELEFSTIEINVVETQTRVPQ